MPDFGGGLAKVTVTSALVVTVAFGLTAPSHAAEPKVPVAAADGAHDPADTATPVHPVTDRQNQGHF